MTETLAQSRRIGYARVSTYGQTLDAQLEQLEQLAADGCVKIFRETATGARADRRELLRLIKVLAAGDVVPVENAGRVRQHEMTWHARRLLIS